MSYLGPTETVLRVDPSTGSDRDGLTGPAGGRLATRTGSTLRHLLVDPHGNLTAAEGAGASTIVEAIRTDAYGVELDTYPTTPSGLADVGYGGRFDLAPAGADPLYEFGARDYVPGLGAFASLDTYQGSTTEPRSLHRFAYAWGNPATMIDPTGHVTINPLQLCDAGEDCSADFGAPIDAGPTPPPTPPTTTTPYPDEGDNLPPRSVGGVTIPPFWTPDRATDITLLGARCDQLDDMAACAEFERALANVHQYQQALCVVYADVCEAQRTLLLAQIGLAIEAGIIGLTLVQTLGASAVAGAPAVAATRSYASGLWQLIKTAGPQLRAQVVADEMVRIGEMRSILAPGAKAFGVLRVGDAEYVGWNAPRMPITIKVNVGTKTHAEAMAFQAFKNSGSSGSRGIWIVTGEDVCPFCAGQSTGTGFSGGGLGSLMRGVGIDELIVIDSRGVFLIPTSDRPTIMVPLEFPG